MALIPQGTAETPLETVVDDRYRIIDRLGKGAMGVVYKVEHLRMGKIAALKLLHPRLCAVPAVQRRFRIEAEAISQLNHPNIVQVFDYGHWDDAPYIVMEYIHGENLGKIIARDGPLSLRRLTPFVAQICDALMEAHGAEIVHRDLKPENILISRTRAGQDLVKVVDFGLAKVLQGVDQTEDSTAGQIMGTPYYMAPEQIRGKGLDHRADIYALGSMIYRALTGHQVFTAQSTMGVLTKQVSETPRPPSEVADPSLKLPSAIDEVILKALEKDPAARFAHAADLKAALLAAATRALSSELVLTPTPEAPRRWSDLPAAARSSELSSVELTPLPTPRLTRADLGFERRMKRGRYLRLLILLGLLAGGAFAFYRFVMVSEPTGAFKVEREPNNEPDESTPLKRGAQIEAKIGKRLGPTTSDRDWYRLEVDGSQTQVLNAHTSSIPNIDLCIELYDRLGGLLLRVDSAPAGGPETLTNYPVRPGPHYLLVRQYWKKSDRVPNENITDPYRLTVDWSPLKKGWEIEPNDTKKRANPLAPGETVRGYLGRHDDRDTFMIQAPQATKVSAHIDGIADVNVVLELWKPGAKRPILIDRGGAGKAETLRSLTLRQGKRYWLRVRRRAGTKLPSATRRSRSLPGIGEPYSLKLIAR